MKACNAVRKASLIVLLLTLGGCWVGHVFNVRAADDLLIGVSTVQDAERRLGTPTSTQTRGDGTVVYNWVFASVNLLTEHEQAVTLVFGRDGRLIDKSTYVSNE